MDALCTNEFPAQSAVTRDLAERAALSAVVVARRGGWLAPWLAAPRAPPAKKVSLLSSGSIGRSIESASCHLPESFKWLQLEFRKSTGAPKFLSIFDTKIVIYAGSGERQIAPSVTIVSTAAAVNCRNMPHLCVRPFLPHLTDGRTDGADIAAAVDGHQSE